MFDGTTVTPAAQPMIEACRPLETSVNCPAMSVTYLATAEDSGMAPVADRIEILIPSDDAIFEASYCKPAVVTTALIRGPEITIVPAAGPHPVYRQRRSDMLVIALDPIFYREKILGAMGCEAPDIVERYTGSDPFVREMGNALRGEFRSSQIPSTEYLECWAGVIAIHLANAYGNRRLASSHMLGLPHNKLAKVLGFIEKHLGDTIQVEDLARTIFMSPFHFARMFKLAVGQSPHAYITCQRMQRAKDLLCNSELPLVDVAGNLGFQTQAHFTGVFRRHVGSTPRAYRLGNRASPGASSFADVQVARNGALI